MMEDSEPSPSPQKEVLIIPLRDNFTPTSTTHETSGTSSPQTTPTSPVSLPTGTSTGSQLFVELLEAHARRSPGTSSPEPAAPPSREATPTSHVTPPPPIPTPQSLNLSVQGSQLFVELLEAHARRSPRTASPEHVAPPSREATPTNHVIPPPSIPTPQSLNISPTIPTSPQQPSPTVQGGHGLGSPELLKELKQPHTLKHVSAHKGLTTVFSGRGRTPSSSSLPTNHGEEKLQRLSNGMKR